MRQYRKAGWVSARTAGSKSPVDVFAFLKPEFGRKGYVHFIQIKTKGKNRRFTDIVTEKYVVDVTVKLQRWD